jgi:hypothetical protein
MESHHSAGRVVEEVPVRFGSEIHAAKNGDRVILCAYRENSSSRYPRKPTAAIGLSV